MTNAAVTKSWECPNCLSINLAAREACFKCGWLRSNPPELVAEARLASIARNVNAIQGYVKFMVVVLIISIILSLLSTCGTLV